MSMRACPLCLCGSTMCTLPTSNTYRPPPPLPLRFANFYFKFLALPLARPLTEVLVHLSSSNITQLKTFEPEASELVPTTTVTATTTTTVTAATAIATALAATALEPSPSPSASSRQQPSCDTREVGSPWRFLRCSMRAWSAMLFRSVSNRIDGSGDGSSADRLTGSLAHSENLRLLSELSDICLLVRMMDGCMSATRLIRGTDARSPFCLQLASQLVGLLACLLAR